MFQCLNDRVLVHPSPDQETVTKGGIILPENVRYSSRKGIAVNVGPGPRDHETGKYSPMNVQKGDVVHYVLGAGIDVQLDGERYLVIPEVELIAIERGPAGPVGEDRVG